MSNRFWLSACAFIVGAMVMMTFISLDHSKLVDFRSFMQGHVIIYAICLLGPLVYWLYIFFRRRGMRVILSSRPHLSASALLFGELLVLTLGSLRILAPIDFANFSLFQTLLYVASILAPVLLWINLFFGKGGHRGKSNLKPAEEV